MPSSQYPQGIGGHGLATPPVTARCNIRRSNMLHEPIGAPDRVVDLAPRGAWHLTLAAFTLATAAACPPLCRAAAAHTHRLADTRAAAVAATIADPSRPARDTTRAV